MNIPRAKALWMYERMVLIRKFEQRVREEFTAGRIPGFMHLYIGEEAVATGVCAALNDEDYLFSTHRGHGHCLAKGCDPRLMFAELLGRAGGYCKGKGGSMHICDMNHNMMGASGIVGGSLPLANGAALTAVIKKTGRVAVSFFGDGATNQGCFHEALNLASIWNLPTIYVVENNGYAEATPVEYVARVADLAQRARAYCIPGVVADGQDVVDVYQKAKRAVKRARDGKGPTLLECKTYRYDGHYVGDPGGYRGEEEIEAARRRDPISLFRTKLIKAGVGEDADLDRTDGQCEREIEQAVKFAEASPLPAPTAALEDVYVRY